MVGDPSQPGVLERADLEGAVGFVAGTDNDTTNLSLVAAARRINPSLFVAARQNRPASGPLFGAMEIDALLVPTEVVAHEIYAQLSTPLLWRFLREMPAKGDDWAAELVGRLTDVCGTHLQALWKVRLIRAGGAGAVRLARLGHGPAGRPAAQPGGPRRAAARRAAPGDARTRGDPRARLRTSSWPQGDELLLAGWPAARRALGTILELDAAREYVVTGRRVPTSWIWRRLTGTRAA